MCLNINGAIEEYRQSCIMCLLKWLRVFCKIVMDLATKKNHIRNCNRLFYFFRIFEKNCAEIVLGYFLK